MGLGLLLLKLLGIPITADLVEAIEIAKLSKAIK
jgi:hypothetical protein